MAVGCPTEGGRGTGADGGTAAGFATGTAGRGTAAAFGTPVGGAATAGRGTATALGTAVGCATAGGCGTAVAIGTVTGCAAATAVGSGTAATRGAATGIATGLGATPTASSNAETTASRRRYLILMHGKHKSDVMTISAVRQSSRGHRKEQYRFSLCRLQHPMDQGVHSTSSSSHN